MKKMWLISFWLLSAVFSNAQTSRLESVLSIKLEKMGPIYQNKQVKGYYMFYEFDRIDRKNREYLLKILDENLELVGEKKIAGSNQLYVEDAGYDERNIMIKTVDPATYTIQHIIFDETAQRVDSRDLVLDRRDFVRYREISAFGLVGSNTIHAITENGFVSISASRPGKTGYEIEYFNPTATKKYWKYATDGSEMHEYASYLGGNATHIYTMVIKKKSALTNIIEPFLQSHNTATGKKEFEVPLRSGGYVMWPTNAFFEGDQILISGGIYEDDDKLLKAKSKGLGLSAYDAKGKEIKKAKVMWEDVGDRIKAEAEVKKPTSIFFHTVLKNQAGNYVFVGESYRRAADGVGIALNVLSAAAGGGSNANVTKLMIDDMVLLEATPEMKLKEVKLFEKASTNARLPVTDLVSLSSLGLIAKSFGSFDYIDTQFDEQNPQRFSVNYLDYDRIDEEKGGKTSYYGSIVFNNGKYTVDKIPLKSTRTGIRRVYPAKSGFVMMLNYNRKEKQIDLELIKVKS